MTLWLIRAGRYGEREDFALQKKVAVVGWDEVSDLKMLNNRSMLSEHLRQKYPEQKAKTLLNWESQLWPLAHEIKPGDLIALPLKHRAVIAIGEVEGQYKFIPENPPGALHTIPVKGWKEFSRNQFDQDLLHSLGAAMTVCRIQRHQAEDRVRAMLAGNSVTARPPVTVNTNDSDVPLDVEQYANDQIIDYVRRKFGGHRLAYLVGAVLQAQGYQIRISPEGPDGGVDILAGRGTLGFETPRLAVQVKSGDSPMDVTVMRELSGVIHNFGADLGLIVSWGGYKSSVDRESARQYFKIRLWNADDLVRMVEEHYEKLPPDIQAELPLKQVWALVDEEEQ